MVTYCLSRIAKKNGILWDLARLQTHQTTSADGRVHHLAGTNFRTCSGFLDMRHRCKNKLFKCR